LVLSPIWITAIIYVIGFIIVFIKLNKWEKRNK
jgi:hypothetical protein